MNRTRSLFIELKTRELTFRPVHKGREWRHRQEHPSRGGAQITAGIGPITARKILDNLSMAQTRQIGGLCPQQRWAVIAATG